MLRKLTRGRPAAILTHVSCANSLAETVKFNKDRHGQFRQNRAFVPGQEPS